MKKILLGICLVLTLVSGVKAEIDNSEQVKNFIYTHGNDENNAPWCKKDGVLGNGAVVNSSVSTYAQMLIEAQNAKRDEDGNIKGYIPPENCAPLTIANWNYIILRAMVVAVLNQTLPKVMLAVLKAKYAKEPSCYKPLAEEVYATAVASIPVDKRSEELKELLANEATRLSDAMIYAKGFNIMYLAELLQKPEKIEGDLPTQPEREFVENKDLGGGDTYSGEIKDDQADGYGIYKWKNGSMYEGQWQDNQHHGKGVYKWPNGDIYKGQYVNDQRHGKGTYTYADEDIYEGDWQDGKRHGQGTHKWHTGSIYKGDWQDDKHHGKGTYTYANGDQYEGEWKDNQRHGKGTYTCKNGNQYTGEFEKDNLKPGSDGTLTIKTGSKVETYEGHAISSKYFKGEEITSEHFKPESEEKQLYWSFLGDWISSVSELKIDESKELNGDDAVLEYFDGGKYTGKVIEGKRDTGENKNTKGTMEYSNGNKYEGGWKGGLPHGQGTFTWKKGNSFIGEFKEGVGKGKMTYLDKTEAEGELDLTGPVPKFIQYIE